MTSFWAEISAMSRFQKEDERSSMLALYHRQSCLTWWHDFWHCVFRMIWQGIHSCSVRAHSKCGNGLGPCPSSLSARLGRMHRWRLDATSQKCMSWALHATSWAALAVRRWQGTRFSVTLLVGAAKLPLPVLFIHTLRELKYTVLKITDQTSVCLSGLSVWLSWSCSATSHSTSTPALICITEQQIPAMCYCI